MNGRMIWTAMVSLGMLAAVLGGCGEDGGSGGGKGGITLSYDRAPEYQIPEKIKHLAVQEFAGQGELDQRWASITSDKVMSKLDEANHKFDRYQLVDRNQLKAILAERDLQLAFSSPAEAAKHAGKLKAVDAIVYGDVKVGAQEQEATKTTIDFATRSPKTVTYTKLYCTAIVSITMVDLSNGKTLFKYTSPQQVFDSDKDQKKGFMDMIKGSSLPPTEACLDILVSRCVDDFVAKISPTTVQVTERLAKCSSEQGKTGNDMASEGAYDEALTCYEQAIEADAADHGALFNAGLMCEAKGDLDKAADFYSRAISVKADKKYIHAKMRVRKNVKSDVQD